MEMMGWRLLSRSLMRCFNLHLVLVGAFRVVPEIG